jgi:hypothetical protein
MCKPSHHCRK